MKPSQANRPKFCFSQLHILSVLGALIFSLVAATSAAGQTESVFHNFDRPGPSEPVGLIADPSGDFYGLSFVDEPGGSIAIGFELNRHTAAGQPWAFSELFTAGGHYEGYEFGGGLTFDKSGNLYATAGNGGNGLGLVVEWSPPTTSGAPWKETVLYTFQGPDGHYSQSGLILDEDGNLYGTTTYGGTLQGGTVFELSPPAVSGGAWTKTTLYNFGSKPGKQVYFGGCYPAGRLAFGPHGTILGVTSSCGLYGGGVVFQLTPSPYGGTWAETVLHQFGAPGDGSSPRAGVVAAKGGILYGTTAGGGPSRAGNVYQLVPPTVKGGGWQENVLHNFANSPDGCCPVTPVVLGDNGDLYGVTAYGGIAGEYTYGVVYEIAPPVSEGSPWTETLLYSFTGGLDGGLPTSLLYLGGSLYGTTASGGINGIGAGTAFVITF